MTAKRRILLVDDELTILLTMKAVLEINGFEVDTAASAREAKAKLKHGVFQMVITDMRMENETSGRDVVDAARKAPYNPAVAMLTAFPEGGNELDDPGADKMLVKPMGTRELLSQLESLLKSHEAKKQRGGGISLAASEAKVAQA